MSPSTTETSITVQDIIQDWEIRAVIPAAFHKHHKQQIQQLGDHPHYGSDAQTPASPSLMLAAVMANC